MAAAHLFRAHGELCAKHPWEVIVATMTLTVCMVTVDQQQHPPHQLPAQDFAEYNAADVIVMTVIRCLAIIYTYYQFCNLHRLGSKYILGIAALFTVFSSFVFTSTVLNLLRIQLSEMKDALFFFLLLIDLSKTAMLAEFALSASDQDEEKSNIARGMSVLGPTITLDTIVDTLVIGVGTLSGVRRLEMLSCFASLSVIVNYVVFMTFYPACLSLILELSPKKKIYAKNDVGRCLISRAFLEEGGKSNPVIQRVKVIMSVGLMAVHVHSWWSFSEGEIRITPFAEEQRMSLHDTAEITILGHIMKWVTLSVDHIVILILLLALIARFIFFENKESYDLRMRRSERNHEYRYSRCKSLSSTCYEDKEVQTVLLESCDLITKPMRSLQDCVAIYESEFDASNLTDDEIILLVKNKRIPAYQLEKAVSDNERGVNIRRKIISGAAGLSEILSELPYKNYNYSKVMGACCENVIGYVPIPVGIVGPLLLDDRLFYVPMATTEGCLVASTNRGCRALSQCGIKSEIVADGMTRGPVVRFPSLSHASEALSWMENPANFEMMKHTFDSSSRFARLKHIQPHLIGRLLFIRFVAKTGDAMGMNMLSKGTELCLKFLRQKFPNMEILSISGNVCTDKKPSAINWIEGRGKSVVCEAVVPASVVANILKTCVPTLVDVNISKNFIGSAVAGSIGGFNAHAANIVTAIFIATGQDPAQNVSSSNCMTIMEPSGEDLYISCTMPSIEVGTVGGGTVLPPQAACLEMLGVRGANTNSPGENASQLAKIVCATVLAGELSLMAALTAGDLVRSHLKYNRSQASSSQDQGDVSCPT